MKIALIEDSTVVIAEQVLFCYFIVWCSEEDVSFLSLLLLCSKYKSHENEKGFALPAWFIACINPCTWVCASHRDFQFWFSARNINRQMKSGSLEESAAYTTGLLKTGLG